MNYNKYTYKILLPFFDLDQLVEVSEVIAPTEVKARDILEKTYRLSSFNYRLLGVESVNLFTK